jgi:hypothetical protein
MGIARSTLKTIKTVFSVILLAILFLLTLAPVAEAREPFAVGIKTRLETTPLFLIDIGSSVENSSQPVIFTTGRIYYLSPSGDDSHDGQSPAAAWQTINAINNFDFARGDVILLEGGQTFSGNIYLDNNDCTSGPPAKPIVIGSYGSGRATIEAGTGAGLYVYNCGQLEISNLKIVGDGRLENSESGIFFYTDLPGDIKLERIYLNNLEVSGFRKAGINLGAWNNLTGYQDVRITNSNVHHNGGAGITMWGFFDSALPGHPHANIYVAYNTVYDNPGDPTVTGQHTGNGIVLGNVDGAVIEYNEAHHNGAANVHTGGGPVGIWAWDCNNVTIQFNESHHNQTQTLDGGGFDLDGGCTNSVMQYNYSHDNAGAGYLMAEFIGARPMRNNIIRYNLSVNDGRKGNYGAVTLWRGNSIFDGLQLYNNTIYVTGSPTGQPKAFRSMSDEIRNVVVYNNNFVTTEGVPLIALEGADNNQNFIFAGNNYYSSGETLIFDNGGAINPNLETWRAGTGQETVNGQPVGLSARPLFVDPTGRLGAASYQLQPDSPLTNRGLDLTGLGLNPGPHDLAGNALPQVHKYDVGAFEREGPLTRGTVMTFIADKPPPRGDGESQGAFIELEIEPTVAEWWTVIQWQDGSGGWHVVEGWQSPLEAGGYQRWWIAPKDFGTGPFRWVITKEPGGPPLFTSPSFNLPGEAKQAVQVELGLEW